MEVNYELTQKNFYDSFIAHRNRTALNKWSYRLFGFFAVFLVCVGLLGLVMRPGAQALVDLARLSVLAFLWIALTWVLPWWSAKNQFSRQPRAKGVKTMMLDAAGIRWRWDGGSAEIEWKDFIRWVECNTEFLIYSSPACFNIVPKRALPDEKLAEFRTILTKNVLLPSSKRKSK
jgi:hypothetical protein